MAPSPALSNADLKGAEALLNLVEALVLRNGEGRVIGRAVWKINLAFHDGHLRNVRERAWQVLDHFVHVCPRNELVWWGKGKPMQFDSAAAQKQMTRIRTEEIGDTEESMMPSLGGGAISPMDAYLRNAQPYFLKMNLDEDTPFVPAFPNEGAAMSVLQMGLPLEWILNQAEGHRAVWFTQKAVELMQPFWCTAGWGVALPPDGVISSTGGEQQVLYPFLTRFPGMEAMTYLKLSRPHFNKAMYSVNWLNFVSDPLLNQLGGRAAVQQAVSVDPLLRAQAVGNCLMIVAGEGPGLGDTERGITLPGYGAAARLLKPIRVKKMSNDCVAPPPYGSGDEAAWDRACDAYLSRFDQY